MPSKVHFFTTKLVEPTPPEAGLYTWDIEKDLLFADPALADLFGLDPDSAASGLPFRLYLDRVHPDDRGRLARAISDVIVADIPQQSTYRVLNATGAYVSVEAFGRAFRDAQGKPVHYAGIVVPTSPPLKPQ